MVMVLWIGSRWSTSNSDVAIDFLEDQFSVYVLLYREPRKVLSEFGLTIKPQVKVVVHDSTADCRYIIDRISDVVGNLACLTSGIRPIKLFSSLRLV